MVQLMIYIHTLKLFIGYIYIYIYYDLIVYKTLFIEKEFKRYVTETSILITINLIYINHIIILAFRIFITLVSIRTISIFKLVER
jgi:hypothetical protein